MQSVAILAAGQHAQERFTHKSLSLSPGTLWNMRVVLSTARVVSDCTNKIVLADKDPI